MPEAMPTDEWWVCAFESIEDEDGTLEQARAMWAEAIAREFSGAVSCDPGAFGPLDIGEDIGSRFRTKPWVAVTSTHADPVRLRSACDAAWNRFMLVDVNGDELTSDELEGEIDPVGYPVRQADTVFVGWDWHTYPDEPAPAKAATMLRILAEELRAHDCVPAHIGDANPAPAAGRL